MAPGARRSEVVGRHGEGWKVRVDAPADRGRANDRVCSLLAELAGVRTRDVSVAVGTTSRDKLVDVAGIEQHELERLLDAASGK